MLQDQAPTPAALLAARAANMRLNRDIDPETRTTATNNSTAQTYNLVIESSTTGSYAITAATVSTTKTIPSASIFNKSGKKLSVTFLDFPTKINVPNNVMAEFSTMYTTAPAYDGATVLLADDASGYRVKLTYFSPSGISYKVQERIVTEAQTP